MTGEITDKAPQTTWYSLESEVVLLRLSSCTNGLKMNAAHERLKDDGPNRLTPSKLLSRA